MSIGTLTGLVSVVAVAGTVVSVSDAVLPKPKKKRKTTKRRKKTTSRKRKKN